MDSESLANDSRLDDLYDYDDDQQDDAHEAHANRPPVPSAFEHLGIDEEVKITKSKRRAVPLDETRLASDRGIPRLQKVSKNLKLRGKGHEFSDVAYLLRTFQLWLDDLYPRAKFADGLAMVEKLGHKRSMHRRRMDWIKGGSGRRASGYESDARHQSPTPHPGPSARPREEGFTSPEIVNVSVVEPERESRDEIGEQTDHTQPCDSAVAKFGTGIPEEDELDALLAETSSATAKPAEHVSKLTPQDQPDYAADDPFADDEDALREMEMF